MQESELDTMAKKDIANCLKEKFRLQDIVSLLVNQYAISSRLAIQLIKEVRTEEYDGIS